jgi:cytosine/adenosine deaminase-related metal-dependent hydrolase
MHTVRSANHHRWLSARQIVQMATVEGARVLRQEGKLGLIRPGARADLALLDLTTPAFTPLNDPFQHLVYCETGSSVRTVLVDGRVVLEEGKLLTVDADALLAEARESWHRRKRDIPAITPEGEGFLAQQELYQQRIMTEPYPVSSF